MRKVALGQWHYFTWHLPASALLVLAFALAVVMARSLSRNAYGHAARALRWRILSGAALCAGASSAVVVPYLTAAASIAVDGEGTWHLRNYLGIPLASVPATEVRELRGVDLGGLGIGGGYLELRRADGRLVRSVRLSRDALDDAWRALGYSAAMVQNSCGDERVAAHQYAASGPVFAD